MLAEISRLVRQAGELFFDETLSGQRQEKGLRDYVTQTDATVQGFLRQALTKQFPKVDFLGEEQPSHCWDFQGPVWVLDPVDGTANLIHHLGYSAISLALVEAGRPVLGVVYNPYTRELFSAREGNGAFLNGRPIRVSLTAALAEALVAVGTAPGARQEAPETFRRMARVYAACQDIRRMGAASLELCAVACGRLEGFYEDHLKPWDYAAGMLLVQEAGGTVSTRQGKALTFRPDGDIFAANGCLAQALLALL